MNDVDYRDVENYVHAFAIYGIILKIFNFLNKKKLMCFQCVHMKSDAYLDDMLMHIADTSAVI